MGSSTMMATKIMRHKYPGLPDVYMAYVDVRDVAIAHLKAITNSFPNGRYILAEGIIYKFSQNSDFSLR